MTNLPNAQIKLSTQIIEWQNNSTEMLKQKQQQNKTKTP